MVHLLSSAYEKKSVIKFDNTFVSVKYYINYIQISPLLKLSVYYDPLWVFTSSSLLPRFSPLFAEVLKFICLFLVNRLARTASKSLSLVDTNFRRPASSPLRFQLSTVAHRLSQWSTNALDYRELSKASNTCRRRRRSFPKLAIHPEGDPDRQRENDVSAHPVVTTYKDTSCAEAPSTVEPCCHWRKLR